MKTVTAVVVSSVIGTLIGFGFGYTSGATHSPEVEAKGDSIQTPTGKTKVFKFEDDDGSKCYIAEGARDDVALQCEITP